MQNTMKLISALSLLLNGLPMAFSAKSLSSAAAESSCQQYTLQAGDTCLKIGAAMNITYAQILSWNQNLYPDCSNLNKQPDGKICISNPSGDFKLPTNTHGATSIATTAAPTPSPLPDNTNTYCGEYSYVELGQDCSTLTNKYGITLKDFLFLNPQVWTNCTNLMADYYYCVEPVGDIKTYPEYGGPTRTKKPFHPSKMTSTPERNPFKQQQSITPPIPLANGTRSDCFAYTSFDTITDNAAADCWSLASILEATPEDLVLWNPSLANNAVKEQMNNFAATPTVANPYTYPCTLAANSSYCIALMSPTPEPAKTSAPPSPRAAGEDKRCNRWYQVKSYSTCSGMQMVGHITFDQLYFMNPSIGEDCTMLAIGTYYCLSIWPDGGPPDDEATTTTTKGTTTSSIHTTPKPSPTQAGLISSCNRFYEAKSGDTCDRIISTYGTFTFTDFLKWNPAVKSDCSGLWADTYYCVGVPGTPTQKPTTTSTSQKPVNTCNPGAPEPVQPGVVCHCEKWHLVKDGTTCDGIINYDKISAADFYKWNPKVGTDCKGLWNGYNVCVGVAGGSKPTPTTTSKPVETCNPGAPQPVQPGAVCHCKKWHLVKDGTTCDAIIKYDKIKAADFYKWNPKVGTDCKGLWKGYNVCVGV